MLRERKIRIADELAVESEAIPGLPDSFGVVLFEDVRVASFDDRLADYLPTAFFRIRPSLLSRLQGLVVLYGTVHSCCRIVFVRQLVFQRQSWLSDGHFHSQTSDLDFHNSVLSIYVKN